MPRRIARWLLVAAMTATVLTFAVAPSNAVDKDCADFSTQKQAQDFYLAHDPDNDPHRLDSDGDRIVCESLPCPCSNDTTPSVSTGATTLRQHGRVVHIVDGDTVDVRLASNGVKKRVRLLGIDTPEKYGPTVECGAYRATDSLVAMAPIGTRVVLVSDPTQALKDRYDRLLRYVVRSRDAVDLNRRQISKGMARVYVYNNDPFKRVGIYRTARDNARAANRGLWATCW